MGKPEKYCNGLPPEEYFRMYVRAYKEAKAWKLIAEGQEKILIAYRLDTGKPPPEKAFSNIEKGRKILAELEGKERDEG